MYIKVGDFIFNLNYMVALSFITFFKWLIINRKKKKKAPIYPGRN